MPGGKKLTCTTRWGRYPPSGSRRARSTASRCRKPAAAILQKLAATRSSDFVFPGGKPGKPLSNMALLALLKRMGRPDLTVHGFRSAFRDWAAERTNVPHEVCEMALAHAIGDKMERAYRRSDLFVKRRQLMEAWAR